MPQFWRILNQWRSFNFHSMAKRRSRITYAPKSQPKSSGSERNQSASSNAHEISTKEKATRRNKRTNVSSTTSQEQEPIAKV